MSLAGGVGSDYRRWEQEAHREGHKFPADGLDMHISSALKRDFSQLWLRCVALNTAPYRILIERDSCVQAESEAGKRITKFQGSSLYCQEVEKDHLEPVPQSVQVNKQIKWNLLSGKLKAGKCFLGRLVDHTITKWPRIYSFKIVAVHRSIWIVKETYHCYIK